MNVREFQGKSLFHLVIEPDNYQPHRDYPLIIMVHGYASSPEEIARLAPIISSDGYVYACPHAPISFEVRSGRVAYGWSSPGSSEMEVEEEEVQAEALLTPFFDEIMEHYQARPGRVLLMGFSQGGSLSLRCGLPRPDVFAGLASFSGYLPEAGALEERLPSKRTQPVFVSHGTHDQYIPLKVARELRAFLKSQDYSPVYREYDGMRHEVGPAVMEDLVPWIKKVLPPINARNAD